MGTSVKVKYNLKRIGNLIDKLKKLPIIEDVLKNMRGYAIKLEKGHNENGILIEMIDSSGFAKGRLYASPEAFMSNGVSYLFFEYFGTGEYAEMGHIGSSKHFIESGYTQWFIPVSSVDKKLGYPVVNIQGFDFYLAHGVKPNHFLTDAEFQSRVENKQILEREFVKMLKEVCS